MHKEKKKITSVKGRRVNGRLLSLYKLEDQTNYISALP